jgi:hypothetical protein
MKDVLCHLFLFSFSLLSRPREITVDFVLYACGNNTLFAAPQLAVCSTVIFNSFV